MSQGRSATKDPVQKAKYRVSIAGLPPIGFNKVSGLKREIGVIEYDEGGFNATHKLRGREKVEPVTLERGVYREAYLEELYKDALNNPEFRKTVTIELNDNQGNVARSWILAEAWCSSWEGPDMDSSSDDVAMEKIVLQFEYFA